MSKDTQKLTGVIFDSPTFDNPKFSGLKASSKNGFPVYVEGDKLVLDTQEYGLVKLPMTPDRDLMGREEFIGTLQGHKTLNVKADNIMPLFTKGFFGQPNIYINVDTKYRGAKLYGQFGMHVPKNQVVILRLKNSRETLEWIYRQGSHQVIFGSEFMLGAGAIHIEIETAISGTVNFDAVPYVKVGGVY